MEIKVCHLTSVHPIDDVRIYQKECVSLSNHGYKVTLIGCGNNYLEDIQENVKIFLLDVPIKNRIQRVLIRTKAVFKKALEVDADIYHLHDPELIFYGIRLKKKGKIVIFDSHEDVPASIISKTWIWRPFRLLISKLYSIIEKYFLSRFDALVSVTPTLTERLDKINSNTFQITNYPILDNAILRIKPEMNDSISFVGTVTPQWMHNNIIKAIEPIKNITYNLAGIHDERYIQELKKLAAWTKVNYVGKISHIEVSNFLSHSSAGMALCDYSSNVGEKVGSLGNTKLFEYMMAGIPVICTDFILWKNIIVKHNCGVCVEPHNINAIRDAILALISDKENARIMGENGRKLVVEHYNWKTQESILIEMYNKVSKTLGNKIKK